MKLLLTLIFILLLPIFSEEKSGGGSKKQPSKSQDKQTSKAPSKKDAKDSNKDKSKTSSKGNSKNSGKDSGKKSDDSDDKDSGKKSSKSDSKKKSSNKKTGSSSDSKPNKSDNDKASESNDSSSSKSKKKGGKKPSKPTKTTPAPKKDEFKLWDTVIQYVVDNKLQSKFIEIALERIQSRTCLKFEKVNQEDETKSGIYFEKSSGSYAWYGKAVEKKFQRIFLSSATEVRVGYIMFLIGTTLGMFPEHLRSDRDKYVKLEQDHFSNFLSESHKIKDTKNYPTFDMSYDYASLLEFSAKYLSKDGEMTIKPFIKEYVYMMGQRKGFTFNNYKYINYRYCSNACKKKKNSCKNSGYLNPRNCNECNCPNGYKGNLCDKIESSPKSCGTTALTASKKKGTLQKDGIINCTYMIKASSSKNVVQLTIDSVKTKKTIPCLQRKGLEIKYRKDRGAMGLNLCGTFQSISIVSETQDVLIQYIGMNSDDNFKLTYVDKKK